MADALVVAATVTATTLGAAVAAGTVADHTADIAQACETARAHGVELAGVWREALHALLLAAGPAVVAAVVWLLALALPAHGAHRRTEAVR